MKNLYLTLIMMTLMIGEVLAQNVGISDVSFTPNAQAILDLSADRKGFLIPRVTLNSATDPINGSKPEGLMVYNQGGSIGSNGFYFWDGSVWQQVPTVATTVSGSGTLNYLPKWTPDGTTIGDSQLFDDGTNVGIGTNSPDAAYKATVINGNNEVKLAGTNQAIYTEVNAGSEDGINSVHTSSANTSAYYSVRGEVQNENGVGYLGYHTSGDRSYGIYGASGTFAGYFDGNTNVASGNVGIGTNAAASDRLVVAGGRVEFTDNTEATGTSGTGVFEIDNTLRFDGNEIITSTGTPLNINYDNNTNVTIDGTDNTFYIDATNNRVGLSTNNPSQALDVNGKIRMRTGATAGYLPVADANGVMTWTDPTTITTADDGDWTISGVNQYSTVSGNVGIGTTAPTSKLEVQGAANSVAVVTIDQQGTDQYVGTNVQRDGTERWFVGMNSSDDDFIIRANGSTDRVTINTSTGYMGINTTTPASNLNIYNGAESSTQTNYTQALTNSGILITGDYTDQNYTSGIFWNTQNNNPTKPKAGIYTQHATAGTKLFLATSTDYPTGLTNNGIVIDDLGRTGVGTVTPGAQLHVASNGGTLNLEGTDHTYIQFYPDGYGAGRKAWAGYGGSSDNNFTISNEISGAKIQLNTNSGNIIANSLSGSGTRFVVADASGNLSATSSTASGIVTGSGTTNYVTRWTSANTIGTGTMQDNGTYAGVGIAPSSSVRLNVDGGMALNDDDIRLRPATDANHLLGYRNSFGGASMDGPLLMGHQSGVLGTNNGGDKVALFWTNSQRVGIGGMNAPFSALHVNSNGAYATSGNMASGMIVSNGTGGTALNMGTYDAGQYGYIQSAYVNSAGTTRSLLLNPVGGNVGVGTSSPIQNLDVNGRIHINNGVLQRGGAAITGTSDLGLYSRVSGNWIRIVTNGAPVRFFSDDNTGSSVNVSVESGGQLYAEKGFRTERHIRYYKRSRNNGQGGVDNLGNYDFCYLAGVAFRNSDSVSDEDDDYQCNVYSLDINGSADYNEGENEDYSANFSYSTRPYWRLYSECYQDCSNTTCKAICINFDY